MKPVQSSNIEAVGHDRSTGVMHVRFKGGGTYAVHDVSIGDHAKFMTAGSLGGHYHKHFSKLGKKLDA